MPGSESRRAVNMGEGRRAGDPWVASRKTWSSCTAAFSSVKGEVYLRRFTLGCSGRIKQPMSGSNMSDSENKALGIGDFLPQKDLWLQHRSLRVLCVQSWEWRPWLRKGMYFFHKHICSASYVPSTVPSSLQILTHFIPTVTLWNGHYYSFHFLR